MMRSLYSGVSGLKVHQTKMDVIGNNISNVNTIGFKTSKVNFSDVFSQTMSAASSPTAARGGTNPQQIGLGAQMSSIDTIHTKGAPQRTDNPTDLMINGEGFFIVTNDVNAQNKFFTRAGNFSLDKAGNLVTSNGFKVLGIDMRPVQIDKSVSTTATATTKFAVAGNINSGDDGAVPYVSTFDVFDSLGNVHSFKLEFGKLVNGAATGVARDTLDPITLAGDARYTYREVKFTYPNGTTLPVTTTPMVDAERVYAKFNEKGQVVDYVNNLTIDAVSGEATDGGASYAETITFSPPGAFDITMTVDRSNFFKDGDLNKDRLFTQYSAETSVKTEKLDGNSSGIINMFNISEKGEVVAIFNNGDRKTLSTIALAGFDNPAGLMKVGSNMYIETQNSGVPKIGMPTAGGLGEVRAGAIEMSNVDMASEFTDMITTQRGFQANSKIISVTDEMLNELVNLKR